MGEYELPEIFDRAGPVEQDRSLFIHLEDTGVGHATGLIFQLECIEAAGEIAELNGRLIRDLADILDHFAEEAIDLKAECFTRILNDLEGDIGDGRVGVEFNDFMVLIGHRTSNLAFGPDGSQ